MKKRIIFLLTFFIVLIPSVSYAFEIKVHGGKLSVHTVHVPLQDILRHLTNCGIQVSIDPQINPKISVSFKGLDLQRGLASILKSQSYAFVWQNVEGPSGVVSKLAEIQVFVPGKKERMRPIRMRIRRALERRSSDGAIYVKNEILVRINPNVHLKEFENFLFQIGAFISDRNEKLGIYKITLPDNVSVQSVLETISKNPAISGAEPNYAYPIAFPDKLDMPASPAANIPERPVLGNSAPIAVLDSGFSPAHGLEDLVLASFDVLKPDEPISDSLGHGTQMAMVAAGVISPFGVDENNDSNNPIIPIRVFDDDGVTTSFDLMRSVLFAVENGARVMSLSWGTEVKSDFLRNATEFASSNGLVIVASAGNEPTGKPVYPAAYPSVIGVGALGSDGKPWEKSNFGTFVELYAPGVATFPLGYKGKPGAYAGTSISAAYIANVISNYLSVHPQASRQEIISVLHKNQQF